MLFSYRTLAGGFRLDRQNQFGRPGILGLLPLEDADDRILDTEHLIGIVADLDFHSVGSRHLAADIGGQGAVCSRRCRKQGEGYSCN